MTSYWAERSRPVSLITFDPPNTPCHYAIHSEVALVYADLLTESRGRVDATIRNLRRVFRLRRLVLGTEPESIISFGDQTNVLALLAVAGTGIPVIPSERVDPRCHDIGRMWSTLRRWTYPFATRIVVQTDGVRDSLPEKLRKKSVTIPNPVPTPASFAKPEVVSPSGPVAVAMGRLTRQKGFDLLLEAFARVAGRRENWSLVIWGEGPDRPDLEALSDRLGLAGRVHLAGHTADPESKLAGANLFVLPSRYEGFPNALCEAMAVGLPVVAADCDSGPADIIRSGSNGLLVPVEDITALAQAMDHLMGDAQLRSRIGENARAVAEQFSVPRVMASWDSLLSQVP